MENVYQIKLNPTSNSFSFRFSNNEVATYKDAKSLQDFLDQVKKWEKYKAMLVELKKDLAYLDECLYLDEDTEPETIIKYTERELTEIRYKLKRCIEED